MRKQRGYSLIELMIGMLVGLIVLSGVIYAFVSSLQSGRDVRNSALLNREGSSLIDILTGEVRRTGYFPVELVVSGATSPFGAGSADLYVAPAGSCVLFSYYDESIPSPTVVTRGFLHDGATIYYGTLGGISSASCSTSAIKNLLNDSSRVEVTNLSISIDTCTEITTTAISAAAASMCQQASVADKTYTRALKVSLSLAVPGTDWAFEAEEYVRLPNDLSD